MEGNSGDPGIHPADLLFTQVANKIRHQIEAHKAAFPSVIEIPSKDHPYDPAKDSLMARVEALMGAGGR